MKKAVVTTINQRLMASPVPLPEKSKIEPITNDTAPPAPITPWLVTKASAAKSPKARSNSIIPTQYASRVPSP